MGYGFLGRLWFAVKVELDLLDDAGGDHLDGDKTHEEAAEAFEGDEPFFADDFFDGGGG